MRMTKRTEWRPNDVPIHQEPWLLIASIAVWWLPLTECFSQSYRCLMICSLTSHRLIIDCSLNVFHRPNTVLSLSLSDDLLIDWTVCLMIVSWMFLTGFTTAASVPPWWYKTFRYHVYLNVWIYLLTIEPLTNDIQNSFITAYYGILLYTALLKTNGFYF